MPLKYFSFSRGINIQLFVKYNEVDALNLSQSFVICQDFSKNGTPINIVTLKRSSLIGILKFAAAPSARSGTSGSGFLVGVILEEAIGQVNLDPRPCRRGRGKEGRHTKLIDEGKVCYFKKTRVDEMRVRI